MPRRTPSGKKTAVADVEDKLKREYPNNPRAVYGTLNRWLRAEHRISELFVGDGRDAINVDHHVPEVMDALIDAEIAREKDHD